MFLSFLENLLVDHPVVGGGDGQERALKVTLLVLAEVQLNLAALGETTDALGSVRADDDDFGARIEQLGNLALGDLSAANDDAPPLGQVQENRIKSGHNSSCIETWHQPGFWNKPL